MGRLIDADVLMEYFKRLSDECSSENNYEYSNLYDCVCAEIMTQPTAYDVEKVVKELEKNIDISEHNMKNFDNPAYHLCYAMATSTKEAFSEAMKIVKAGGVDEHN